MSEKIVVQVDSFLEDIIFQFLDSKKEEIPQWKGAIEKKDFSTIEHLAHKIAGTAGSYGLEEVGNIGAKIEELAGKQELDEINVLFTQLENILLNIEIQFKPDEK